MSSTRSKPVRSFHSIHMLLIAVSYRGCGRNLLAKLDTVINSLSAKLRLSENALYERRVFRQTECESHVLRYPLPAERDGMIVCLINKHISWLPQSRGLNSAGNRRIPDPASPSWDPSPLFGDQAPKLGDPLEFYSALSLLVITHHDSYKYAFETFSFQRVAVVFIW